MAVPEIKPIGYTPRPIIRRDINAFARGMETLTARHQAAIQQQTAIENQLAQVELNAAEDEWKYNYARGISNKIDSEAQLGNYAGALTTAVKEAGKAFSNPALLGRMRANQSYKQYQDELLKRNDIGEETKEYYREMNPYKYEDKVDEQGNIIGGTEWKPNSKPVSTIDTYKLMQTALQSTAREAGGGNTIYFMDDKGNYTTDINKSIDGLPYISKGGKYESLGKDKLRKGIEAAIAATPGAAESIQQDYNVDVWKTKKLQASNKDSETPITSQVTDDKGMLLTKDQYLEKMIDPFIKSATYVHSFSNIDALAGLTTGAARLRKSGETKVSPSLLPKTPSGYYESKVASASGIFAEKNAARQGLSQIATEMGVIVKPTASGDSIFEAIKTMSQRKGTIIPKQAIDVYNAYQESNRKFDEMVPAGTSNEQRQALEFTSALDNGVDLSQLGNNKFAKEYINTVNKVFGDSAEKIYFRLPPGSTSAKDIIAKLDGEHEGSHRNLGVTLDRDNDGSYLVLDRKHATNYYLINKVMNEFKDNAGFRSFLGNKTGYDTVLRDNNGVKERISGISNKRELDTKLYDKANKYLENFIAENSSTKPVNVPITTIPLNDITVRYVENNGGKSDDIKRANERIQISLNNYQAQMGEMYIGGVGKVRKSVENGEEKAEIWNMYRAINSQEPERISIGVDDRTLNTVITVAPNLKEKANDDKLSKKGLGKDIKANEGFTIIVPNALDSEVKQMILTEPSAQAKNKLYNNVLSGFGKTPVGDSDYLYSQDGTNYIYNTKYGQVQINDQQAANVLQNKQYLDNLKYSIYNRGGQDKLTEEEGKQVVNNIINNYKSIYGLNNVAYKDLPGPVINQITDALMYINKSY